MDYTKETLEKLVDSKAVYIFEFKPDGWKNIYIGYLDSINHILELNQSGGLTFSRSALKRIICLNTWRVINKDDINAKKFSYIDIFELNELAKKAGYEVI